MKKISTRIMCVFLTVAILIVSLPLTVFATLNSDGNDATSTTSNHDIYENKDIIELTELRTANTKQFRLDDGSYYLAQYDTDVHYIDDNGVWQDIDNTLSVSRNEIATSNAKIKFAKKITGNESIFTLHNGNQKLTLSLNNAIKKTEGRITNVDPELFDDATELQKMTTLNKISASVIYEDILCGVDLEYIIQGSNIKENIIVKEKADEYVYSFTLELNNLEPILKENGEITIKDTSDNSVVYVIPAPIMWDASNTISSDVSVQLADNGNGKYTLTISADENWINDSEREFPITIDPPIQTNSEHPVIDLNVSTASTSTSQSTQSYLLVNDTWRAYWKLSTLPSLPRGFYITDAQISMTCYSGSANSGFVGVYDVLTDWDSTLTWNKVINTSSPQGKPDADFADFEYVDNSGIYSWNITEIVKKWYNGANYGVTFAPAAGKTINGVAAFNSNEYSVTASRPKLSINYQIMRGIESYWSYTSQSAGFAGDGAINNATGELVFTIPTLTTTDALMPFTPTLVYNSSLATCDNTYSYVQTSYGTAFTPNGFKLNISETLLKKSYIKEDGTTEYLFVWSDGDGTEHYFMPTDTDGTYTDEDGLHLTLREYSTVCTIMDDSDNMRSFSKQSSTHSQAISGWYLTSIIDNNGNRVSFGFDSSQRPTSVNLTPNGYSAIEQLRISYTSSGYPYAVWNPTSGEGVVFRYSSTSTGSVSTSAYNYLRYVIRAHGGTTETQWSTFYNTNSNSSSGAITVDAVAEYTYINNRLATAKNNLSQYKVSYTYDSNGRITSVKEIAGANNTIGQQISLTYGASSVVIRTSGQNDEFNDDDDLITTYGFDTYGRVVNCYTTDLYRTKIYGASSGQYVGDNNERSKNNLKSSVQTVGQSSNYLLNGGFESVASSGIPYWSTTGNVTLVSVMEKSGVNCAHLTVNSSVNTSTLYQKVKLDKGEYSLSMYIDTDTTNDDISIMLEIESSSNSAHNVNTEIPINEFYATGNYAFAGVNFTAEPSSSNGKEEFTITVSVAGDPSSDISVFIDDLMLSKTLDAAEFDMTYMGHFETSVPTTDTSTTYTPNDFWSILDYPNKDITVVDSGIAAFGDVLKIVPDLEGTEYVQQVVYSATDQMKFGYNSGTYREDEAMLFTVSGWGKGTDQSYASTSSFGIEVAIRYYDGTTYGNVEKYTFDFDNGITDWQFISGGFATNYRLGIVDTITVTIRYTDHAGIGYFDNISVVKDSTTTDYYNYNDAGYVSSYQNGSNISWYQYDENNNVTIAISSKNTIVYYAYDQYNHIKSEDHRHYEGRYSPSTGTFSGEVTSQYYTTYSYNKYGQIYSECTYDSSKTDGFCTYDAVYDTTSGSHTFGVLLTEKDSLDNITRYFYDQNNGRLLATIYPEGNGVSYTYDAVGNLTSVMPAQVSSDGSSYTQTTGSTSVTYGYDSTTKRLSTITTKPTSSTSTTYSFAYDVFGNTSSVSVGTRTLANYTYNANNGKMNTLTYGNGLTVKYIYDTLDRISEIQYNTGSGGNFETVYKYTYDAAGNVYSIADLKNSEVTMYKYDTQGKLVRSYVYDDDTYLNLYGTSVYYDEQSRLSTVLHSFDYHTSSGTTNDIVRYTYLYSDLNGNIEQLLINEDYIGDYIGDYISGTVNPVYDNLGRMSSKTIEFDVNNADAFYNKLTYDYVINNEHYESGLVSQVTSEVRKGSSTSVVSSTTYNYTYDANGNITKITDGSGVVQYQYTYDALGQLTREDNRAKGYTYVYTYDNAGNITSKKRYAFTTGTLGSVQQTYSYTYNDSTWKDLLTSYNGTNITYDTIGNPTAIGSRELTWQGRELKTCSDGYYSTTTYYYNADGIRTRKEIYNEDYGETQTHEYILSGSQIVRETVYFDEIEQYTLVYLYDELGAPIGIKYRTPSYVADVYDCYFFEKNLQGDIVAVYNANGVRIATYTYDAWGNVTTQLVSGSTSNERILAVNNPFRYRGYYYDIDMGMYYLQSRYYNPTWGRFLNGDDVSYLGIGDEFISYNLFAYCSNNPIMNVDPTGTFSWGKLAAIAAVTAIVAVSVVATIVTCGATSVAGTIAITSAIALTSKATEVAVLQGKKSTKDGDDWIDTVDDMVNSVYENAPKIIGTTPLTKTLGFASGFYAQSSTFQDTIELMKLDGSVRGLLGSVPGEIANRFTKEYLSMPASLGSIAFSYGMAAINVCHTIYSFFTNDPVATAESRGYSLK